MVVGKMEADTRHGVCDGGVECVGDENTHSHTDKHGDAAVVMSVDERCVGGAICAEDMAMTLKDNFSASGRDLGDVCYHSGGHGMLLSTGRRLF